MRRDSLKFTLARIALAYAIALQALLAAFVGPLAAAGSGSFDPSLVLCRTISTGDVQPAEDRSRSGGHCTAMCLTGVCAASDPPATASVQVEFPPRLAAAVSIAAAGDRPLPATLAPGLRARGPPSIG